MATTPINFVSGEGTLQDALNLLKKQIYLELNCHALATVQSVNYENQTLVAQMAYSQSFTRRNEAGQWVRVPEDYPYLLDLPFVVLGGGAFQLTFPIAEGDQCLVLFNDRDIDNWFAGPKPPMAVPNPTGVGSTQPSCASDRLHSFSDGIALVGLQWAIDSYDETHAVIQNGDTKVGVSETKALIKNASISLGTALGNLTTALSSLATSLAAATSSTGDTGIAQIASAGASLSTAISSVASQLSGLLE